MMKRIFMPWLVIRELEQKLEQAAVEERMMRKAVSQLMAERAKLRPKRGAGGRFVKRG